MAPPNNNANVNRRDRVIKIVMYCAFTLIAALIVWLFIALWITVTLKYPQFALQEAQFTTASSINSTILATNPNKNKIRISYDELVVSASYRGTTVTTGAFMAPFDTFDGEAKAVKVRLLVDRQLLVPNLADQLRLDQEKGELEWEFEVTGYARFVTGKFWRGTWMNSRLRVNCPAVMTVEPNTPLRFTTQGKKECSLKWFVDY